MNGHDSEFEELKVPEAISLTFECFDFVVCSFQWAGRLGCTPDEVETCLDRIIDAVERGKTISDYDWLIK